MTRRKILLLEDDTSLGMVLQEHLQMQGFDVTLCVDGQQGLKAFHPGEFDRLGDILDGIRYLEGIAAIGNISAQAYLKDVIAVIYVRDSECTFIYVLL